MRKNPEHIAIIMDGNGRWAKERGFPRAMGHREGAKRVRDILSAASKEGVKILTLFAFSTENWNRPEKEIDFIFDCFDKFLNKERDDIIKKDIRFNVIGRRDRISGKLVDHIKDIEAVTKDNKSFILNIAFDYGGQWDIAAAARKIADDAKSGLIEVSGINEDSFGMYLSLSDQPKPDLLIRTAGELRISNFLLWQIAYSELYFSDVLWPDFCDDEFKKALNEYRRRDRRFGKIHA